MALGQRPSLNHMCEAVQGMDTVFSCGFVHAEPVGRLEGIWGKRQAFISLSTLPESRLHPNLEVCNSKLTAPFQKLQA